MNRLKAVRPGIFLTCLIIGIALFSIYSFSFDKIPDTASNKEILSVGQVSKSITDTETDAQRGRFMATSEGQYTASRGEYDRLAEAKPAAPAASIAQTAEKPAPAAKPAAPAAPAKPKAAPVKAAAKPAPAKVQSSHASDLDVLARLIMAEAQAEPYEAKVAVGAVVINRVQSGQWAGTIKGVIYQKSGGYYQFTPVQNGWINKPADAECIRAAKAALSGADPTNGAQFYYDNSVTNEWILAKPVSTRIGHMTYAY
jgi:spore germination cell wall hydrolase CwlJ-like protein